MNVKSPCDSMRLNDPDRAVVNTPEDNRLKFMLDKAESFQKMDTKNTQ